MNPSVQAPAMVPVLVHPSRFPGAVEAALVAALDARRMGHGFHYESPKQAQRWLRLHEAFSPARRDASTLAAYDRAAERAVAELGGPGRLDVLSLGCGGGQKDVAALRLLVEASSSREIRHVPADVGVGLTIIARAAAVAAGVAAGSCHPVVLDLEAVEDWADAFREVLRNDARRLVLFFGMMPNFLPQRILARLAGLVGPQDRLLVSANLAPGPDYAAGVRAVLPLYDNAATAEWLQTILLDLGAERGDGRVEFGIAPCPEGSGLSRIEADFVFERHCVLGVAGREWRFAPGERFGLFYSYRHTPERVGRLLGGFGLDVLDRWTNAAGDEGVFLAGRNE